LKRKKEKETTMKKKKLRILCPNGHLGFAPTKEESFWIGAETKPDYYCCDSGSDDIGPGPLGSDTSVSPYAWEKHDLELMLLAARKQGVPMMIGSSGDTGTDSRVDMYVGMIKDLAKQHNMAPFKLVSFYSELDKDYVRKKMAKGDVVEGLDARKNLTPEELEATDRIVAVSGVHPFIKALEMGADVIIGGRSSDAAIFAAAAIYEGFPENNAYYLGKVLECASFCAEPYMAKETVIGTITDEDVLVTAMHPLQRCTIASVAGHAMYERSNPFNEFYAGGMLDMTNCKYEQVDEKTTRVTGQIFVPIEGRIKVKLEGSRKIGERFIGIAGIRDPYTIKNIDKVIDWARSQVNERFAGKDYQLFYHIYGKNGVMGALEPIKEIKSHELCVVVEGVAPTKEVAEEVALIGCRQIFYARLPEVKGTAGTAAFVIDGVVQVPPAYTWAMNHVIPVDDPMEFVRFKESIIE
jgi:hypothetical protein